MPSYSNIQLALRRANSMDPLDSILPSVPINHHSWQNHLMVSSIHTELMNISFCWSANIHVSKCRSLLANVANEFVLTYLAINPVGWGCRIHWLHLCRGVRPPPTSLVSWIWRMARIQPWSFEDCGVPLRYHCSQVHSDLEWYDLTG